MLTFTRISISTSRTFLHVSSKSLKSNAGRLFLVMEILTSLYSLTSLADTVSYDVSSCPVESEPRRAIHLS